MPLKGSQLCHVDGGNLRSLACAKWDVIIKVSQGLFCTRDQEPWEKKIWFRVSHGHGRRSNAMLFKGVQMCHVNGGNLRSLACAPSGMWSLRSHEGCFAHVTKSRGKRRSDLGFLVVTVDGPTPFSSKVPNCATWTVVTYGALHVPSGMWLSIRFYECCFAHVTKSRGKNNDLGFLVVTVDGPTPCSSKVPNCVTWTVKTYGALHVSSGMCL